MANQRILLIGGSGYIGTKLAESLVEDGNEVYISSRRNNDLSNLGVLLFDLLDLDSILIALKDKSIDIVINLASVITAINKNVYTENLQGMENLIYCMNRLNIKKMIFFSTVNVNLTELGPYAKSKLESENLLINSSIEYMILRPNIIYGFDTRNDFFKLLSIAYNFRVLPVIGNKNKKMVPLYIDTLVDFTKIQVANFKNKSIFEVTGNEILSMVDVVSLIKKVVDKKCFYMNVPSSALSLFSFFIPFDIAGLDEDRCPKNTIILENKLSLQDCLKKMKKELL